jgi:two-component system sensor histidine kinase UhpB
MLKNKLLEAEARFQATFEQAAVGIAHVAPDGGWLRVNQRLCEIVGYQHAELISMTFQDITHPDDLNSDLANVHKMLSGELERYSMEKRYFRKDGKTIWINLSVSLVWRSLKVPDYFISVIEDISQRKAAEQEIEHLTNSLVTIQEAERQFLALELHDEIGQRLSAAKIALGLAQRKCEDVTILKLINQAHGITSNLITTIKEIAHRLRPPQLDDFGLGAAVLALVEDLGSHLELALLLDENIGDSRFSAQVELAGYRIVQEALSNVLRHARSPSASVSLHLKNQGLHIQIKDEGIGFNPQSVGQPLSLGLIGMRERAIGLGGQFKVQSEPGAGTIISALLPIK